MPVISDSTTINVTIPPYGQVAQPYNGAIVNAYKASRFISGPPAENAAPPAGPADAGPVTSGPSFGAEGAFQITVPTAEDYYVGVTIGGVTGWKFYPGQDVFNLSSFAGIDPTGTTSCGAALNTALTAIGTAGGGWAVADPGATYLSSVTINIPANVRIVGPRSATIKMANAANLSSFLSMTGGRSGVCGITVDGNKANQTAGGTLVNLNGATYGLVSDCELKNSKGVGGSNGDGVYIGGAAADNLITQNLMTGLDRNGVSNVSGSRNVATYNTIVSPGQSGFDYEPNVDAALVEDNVIAVNTVLNAVSRAIFIDGGNSSPSGTGSVRWNKVQDNIVRAAGSQGIWLGSGAQYCDVSRNTVNLCLIDGLRIGSDHVSILDNKIINNSQTADSSGQGIDLYGSRCTIQGNHISSTLAKRHGFPIYEEGGADHNVITGNVFDGAANRMHTGGASTRVANNDGYNPVGALGPPSVPATTVAYTNAYGVDCTVFVAGGTVTVIAIGGTATGATSGSFRVPAGQTVTLTYSAAPTWTWFGD